MAKIRIEVTARDIHMGLPHNCRFCPITLAVKRATRLEVTTGHIFLFVRNKAVVLNDKCRQFIRDFDAGRPVQPFMFAISVPK